MRNLDELNTYLKNFSEIEGYVQYLSREKIELIQGSVSLDEPPMEVVFWSGRDGLSVAIRFFGGNWYVDETGVDIEAVSKDNKDDIETYLSVLPGKKVKFAQIWKDEADEFCEGFKVKRFVKNVFIGFEGEKNESSV